MSKDDQLWQEDVTVNDESAWEGYSGATPPAKGAGPFRAYALVATLVLLALFGFSRSTWAIPALRLPTRACCRPAAANRDNLPVETGLGGCCSGSTTEGTSPLNEEELRKIGMQFYLEVTGDLDPKDLDAIVEDFGCHQEIIISKGDKLVMRVGYAYGQVYEIPGTR